MFVIVTVAKEEGVCQVEDEVEILVGEQEMVEDEVVDGREANHELGMVNVMEEDEAVNVEEAAEELKENKVMDVEEAVDVMEEDEAVDVEEAVEEPEEVDGMVAGESRMFRKTIF